MNYIALTIDDNFELHQSSLTGVVMQSEENQILLERERPEQVRPFDIQHREISAEELSLV